MKAPRCEACRRVMKLSPESTKAKPNYHCTKCGEVRAIVPLPDQSLPASDFNAPPEVVTVAVEALQTIVPDEPLPICVICNEPGIHEHITDPADPDVFVPPPQPKHPFKPKRYYSPKAKWSTIGTLFFHDEVPSWLIEACSGGVVDIGILGEVKVHVGKNDRNPKQLNIYVAKDELPFNALRELSRFFLKDQPTV